MSDPPTPLQSYFHAERAVAAFLLRHGIEHGGGLRDAMVDHVAAAIRRLNSIPDGSRQVEDIAHEQVRWRINRFEAELDAYRAAGGSRGLT